MQRNAFARSFWLLLLSASLLILLQIGMALIPKVGSSFRIAAFLENLPLVQSLLAEVKKPKSPEVLSLDAVADSLIPVMLGDSLDPLEDTLDVATLLNPGEELRPFFEALLALEKKQKKKVRVAWFGDSMIEGDLIVMSLRNDMQRMFGGEGVGMLPLTSQVAGFRITIQHKFSQAWKNHDLVSKRNLPFPAGLFCSVFVPQAGTPAEETWVSFKPGKAYQRTSRFPEAWLYYGSPSLRMDSIPAETGWAPLAQTWSGQQLMKEYRLDTTGRVHKTKLIIGSQDELTLKVLSKDAIPYYGISIESDSGIIVDNYASRGNSGLALWALEDYMITSFQELLDYDLVILQYGTNAISLADTNYAWYLNSFSRVIRKFKKAFPNTAFLLVSIADRAYKDGDRMTTAPAVSAMIKVQKEVAAQNTLAFFDLFHAMGGKGSMVDWAEREDPLANKDYTHFNFKGARVVSGLINNHLLSSYLQWKRDSLPGLNEVPVIPNLLLP